MIGLGGRGVMGLGLGRSSVSAAAVPWWLAGGAPTPVAAYQPNGAASLAASYVNLVNPGTYDATTTSAPSWSTDRGWIATAAWHLLTGVTASATSWTYLVRYANGPTGTVRFETVLSAYNDNSQCVWLVPRNTSANRRYGNGEILDTASGSSASGVIGAAGNTAYHNGSSVGTIPAGTAPTPQITIGTLNISGTPSTSETYVWPGDVLAVVIYNTSTGHATWVPAVSAAMAAL